MKTGKIAVLLIITSLLFLSVVSAFNEKGAASLKIISPTDATVDTDASVTFEVQGNGNLSSAILYLPTGEGSYTMTRSNETNFVYTATNIPNAVYTWYATGVMKNETGAVMTTSGRAGNFSSLAATSSSYTLSVKRANNALGVAAAVGAAAEANNGDVSAVLNPQSQKSFFEQTIFNIGGFAVTGLILIVGIVVGYLLLSKKK